MLVSSEMIPWLWPVNMASSMLSSDPEKSPPRLTRKWWAGLIGGLVLMAVWSLFNVLVDPTGEFGLSGRFMFNRVPPPAVIAAGTAGNNPAFFTRAIRESEGDVFLIGPSRTWRGFDTCDRPGMLRVAGSSWGLRELSQVQRTVLEERRRPATLLIEVGMPTTERPAITNPAQAAISAALSPRMTVFSVRTVIHSLAGDEERPATYAPCASLAAVPSDWIQAERNGRYAFSLLDQDPRSLEQGRRKLLAMADLADQTCRQARVQHRLIFFTLPASPKPSLFPAFERVFQDNAAHIAADFAKRTPGRDACAISYVNFAGSPPGNPLQQAHWRDRKNWSDYYHFSPELGATALEVLLGPRPASAP